MLDVFFARPYELNRRVDLFGNEYSLTDKFLDRSAPAETAAKHGAVNQDVIVRNAGRIGRRGQRRHRALGRCPNFDLAVVDMSGAGLRLHRRMGEEGDRIVRFDTPDRPLQSRFDVAVVTADLRLLCGESCANSLGDAGTRDAAVAARVPDDRQGIERAFGAPPQVRDDRNRIMQPHHAVHAPHVRNRTLVDCLRRAAEHI